MTPPLSGCRTMPPTPQLHTLTSCHLERDQQTKPATASATATGPGSDLMSGHPRRRPFPGVGRKVREELEYDGIEYAALPVVYALNLTREWRKAFQQLGIGGCRQRPRPSRSAASTWHISSKVNLPTPPPSRLGSTAAVCSASTRVSRPSTSTSGLKLAGRAEVDVGAISHVDSGSIGLEHYGAARAPDRSCPRVPRGERSWYTSPRTQCLHIRQDLGCFQSVVLIGRKRRGFGA